MDLDGNKAPPAATPEQAKAAVEWAAAGAAEQRKVDAQVDAMHEADAPKIDEPPEDEKVKQTRQMSEALRGSLEKLCLVAWVIVDKQVTNFAGPGLALTPEERKALADATVPVVDKYLPDALAFLLGTPEGMLIFTAGTIYGSKLVLPTAPAPSSSAGQSAPPPVGPTAPAPAGTTTFLERVPKA